MSEIAKLRQRLSNVSRNATEYRMTVAEANALLAEIEDLSKPVIIDDVPIVPILEPQIIRRVMDGGTF